MKGFFFENEGDVHFFELISIHKNVVEIGEELKRKKVEEEMQGIRRTSLTKKTTIMHKKNLFITTVVQFATQK